MGARVPKRLSLPGMGTVRSSRRIASSIARRSPPFNTRITQTQDRIRTPNPSRLSSSRMSTPFGRSRGRNPSRSKSPPSTSINWRTVILPNSLQPARLPIYPSTSRSISKPSHQRAKNLRTHSPTITDTPAGNLLTRAPKPRVKSRGTSRRR